MTLFPECYTFEQRHVSGGDELVITCSPTRNAAFYGTVFGKDVLYLCDFSGHYFTEEADVLANTLSNFFRQNGYRRIIMVGFSKSGFGALLLAQLVSRLDADLALSVICFSPQVQVYPRTNPLSFPSYKLLIEKAKAAPRLLDGLQRFGTLAPFDSPNVSAKVFCGGENAEDTEECSFLKGEYVEITKLPFSSHLSHLPFMVDTTNAEQLQNLVSKAYAQNATIEGNLGSEVSQEAFAQMHAMPPVPMLKDLVAEEFDRLKDLSA